MADLELRTDDERCRFWSKVDKSDTCWGWTSAILKNGYGVFMLHGNTVYAHRVAFLDARGKFSPNLVIDHTCRNRRCVNPDHLRELERGENVRIGISYGSTLTHCSQGHPFSGTVGKTRRFRICKICHARRNKEYQARKKLR